MDDENIGRARDRGPDAAERRGGRRAWWVIISVYLVMFAATGYVAFFGRTPDLSLDAKVERLAAAGPDEASRRAVAGALRGEAEDREKRDALAAQAFNVVLGALLGLLSASAATGPSGGDGGA